MRRLTLFLMMFLTLAPLGGLQATAQGETGTGTLRISMVSCPPNVEIHEPTCVDVIEDDGSATVTLPDGSTAALTSFERDENGAYVITTAPGMVGVSGLASENRAHMATDSNNSNDDGGEWYVPADADINGQVTYADEMQSGPFPMPAPGREEGVINLHLMLCEDGYPEDGVTGCEAIEDDGRITFTISGDSFSNLTDFDRNENGSYKLTGLTWPQLQIDVEDIESDDGYETTFEPDIPLDMNQIATWNFVEGHERDVYIYYTPPAGTPDEGNTSGVLTHDANLPPAKPAEEGMSMGGPEGIGGVYIHVLTCEEGVAPSLETCTESVSSVDEIMVDMQGRAPAPLSSFERAEDGSWMVSGPSGEAVLTGMEPIRTDRGITNGQVVDDSTITFNVNSGDEFDLYVIYYFD